MYLMFVHKDKMPSEVARMGKGEKIIVRALLELFIEEENEKAKNGGM